jgi:hypothetical protein
VEFEAEIMGGFALVASPSENMAFEEAFPSWEIPSAFVKAFPWEEGLHAKSQVSKPSFD